MGVLSNRIPREDLKPADHIYAWRTAYAYAHHGIYTGDGKVIHFTRACRDVGTGSVIDRVIVVSSSPASSDIPCDKCGTQNNSDGVIVSCLDCFLSGENLYLFAYSVRLPFFLAKARGGTCTLAASDQPSQVLHRANYLLKHGFGTYNVFKNNCEDFAIYCKTGLLVESNFGIGRSGQLGTILSALSAISSSPLHYMARSVGGLTVVVGTLYCVNRYVSDIGIRRDVRKIQVETLVTDLSMEHTSSPAGGHNGDPGCDTQPVVSC